jgi:hypothetical protein
MQRKKQAAEAEFLPKVFVAGTGVYSSGGLSVSDIPLTAYRSGTGSMTDVTLAQTQPSQSKSASTDAYSTALAVAATLALATGALGAPPGKSG